MSSRVFNIIEREQERQKNTIELIASENFVSDDVLRAVGSCLTNKYSEGYPVNRDTGNRGRYYGGCEIVDELEEYCCQKWKEAFKTDYHCNVQPHSGSSANFAAYMSVLKPGDTILAMNLDNGGHLTHGSSVNFSGKIFNTVFYNVDEDGFIDYVDMENKINEYKPDLILAGASAYASIYKTLAYFGFAVICLIPHMLTLISKALEKSGKTAIFNKPVSKNEKTIYYLGSAALTLVMGFFIPLSVVSSSPTEFSSLNYGPLGLILQIACIFTGLFLVWINIFYLLLNDSIKRIFTVIISIAAIAGPLTFVCFGRQQGVMSSLFYYDTYPSFNATKILLSFAALFLTALLVLFVLRKKNIIIKRVLQILVLTLVFSSVFSVISVNKELDRVNFKEASEKADEYEQLIPLSKNGKNVVLLMLDRAISGYVPYIMEEKPELKETFDGFTYYPNTISFGYSTNYGTPALFGGYEYTPTEMNKRNEESLESKQNEALSVLPVMFSNEGYKVTVLDPPYAGYKVPSDLSIYDKYEGINAYLTEERYLKKSNSELISIIENKQKHNFVYFSLMKCLPVAVQNLIYDGGNYYSSNPEINYGLSFLGCYAVLDGMTSMTQITDSCENTFLMMQNSTTHQPSCLMSPEYSPEIGFEIVENEKKANGSGKEITLSNSKQISHYDTNMAALLKVGEWIKYLKENGVYDNTRIIIVSDHGFSLEQFDYRQLIDGVNLEKCNALLMMKDFNAKGFRLSDDFMTTADGPVYAVQDVISNPMNPFTGKKIDAGEKQAHSQIITTSGNIHVDKNNGNVFDTSDGEWWSVHDNIFDKNNWKKVEVN